MHANANRDQRSPEEAAYFKVPGGALYTVLHRVADPVARVLLVGPFASERHNSYLQWARWARYLAVRQIEALRYDYRGIGESTGRFAEMGFEDWSEDVRLLAAWLAERSRDVPLLLQGLELGAILAGRAFDAGQGDALLLWSPPLNAHQALRSTLQLQIGVELLSKRGEERKSLRDYLRQMEQTGFLDVEGYRWSERLWQSSLEFDLPAGLRDPEAAGSAYDKPVRIVKLGKEAAPLAQARFLGYDDVKDLSWLFADNFEWIATALARTKGTGK